MNTTGVTGPAVDWPRELVDDVADAVASVPGVAGLTAGQFGDLATSLPGRRVCGVRLRHDLAEVAVVLAWGASAQTTVRAIRTRLAGLLECPVDVTIADIETPRSDGSR